MYAMVVRDNRQQGFALLEVLIAMLVAAVTLLGLAQLELRAVQSAQSSLDYTIATVRLNNLTEQLRANLCNNLQPTVYLQTVQDWKTSLPAGSSATTPTTFTLGRMPITLSWVDSRLTSGNSVSLYPVFPDICN